MAPSREPCDILIAAAFGPELSGLLSSRLAESSGAAVEHLEAFAVATSCAAAGVPFAAVLAVANAVGAVGREQWRAHHAAAGRAAASVVERWLVGGASGARNRRG
ncbi:MAG: MYXO-CTERM sorting domain-containing protein [Polyangiaceae bacterium]